MLRWFKNRRRKRLKARPFPAAWSDLIREQFPLYKRLPPVDQEELQGLIHVFLAEKKFEGCGGFSVTETVRVLVAAQACLLLLRRPHDFFPDLKSILVYPSSYIVPEEEQGHGHVVVERNEHRLGESWNTGAVVLAWDSVLAGAADHDNGENLVLHEFAHQLDQNSGNADGAPVLGKGKSRGHQADRYASWSKIMTQEFEALRHSVSRNRRTLLDQYGSTHPAEFFAVSTECFFEKPKAMKSKHPDLYRELKIFFHQDPAAWPHP
jgi:Mlc titration factor MtfA (ptsG expression regulator)